MDNENENNNDFYYGNDDSSVTDAAPVEAAEQTDSQAPNESQPEPANAFGQQPYNGQPYNGQPYNGQPYNPYGMPNEAPKKNTCGIVSLVLGILSTVLACCCYYISIPLGVAAVILGVVSMKKQETTKGFAIAGIVLGSIGFVFAVVEAVSMIYLKQSGMYEEIMRQYMDMFGIDNY